MSIETPFPVEGTITPTEYGYSASLPCASEYMTETEDGTDYLQSAVDRAARKYGEGQDVRVRFTSDRSGMGCGGYELLGKVNDLDTALEKACENIPSYAESEEDARASQFYVAEVIEVSDNKGAESGDVEYILTDTHYRVGSETRGSSPGGGRKVYEIQGGPYDCPPFPHVLALEKWIGENGLSDRLHAVKEDKA